MWNSHHKIWIYWQITIKKKIGIVGTKANFILGKVLPNGPYGELAWKGTPLGRCLEVYKKKKSRDFRQVEVYKRVGKSVISVFKGANRLNFWLWKEKDSCRGLVIYSYLKGSALTALKTECSVVN